MVSKTRLSLGVSRVDDLLLEHGWLGETESDLMGGELVVAVGDSANSALHDLSVQWVEENFLVLLAVVGHSHGSAVDV